MTVQKASMHKLPCRLRLRVVTGEGFVSPMAIRSQPTSQPTPLSFAWPFFLLVYVRACRYKEFKLALKDPYADDNAPDRLAAVGVFDKVRIEPKQIVELTDLEDVPEDSEPLPAAAVAKIKLKFQVCVSRGTR